MADITEDIDKRIKEFDSLMEEAYAAYGTPMWTTKYTGELMMRGEVILGEFLEPLEELGMLIDNEFTIE